MWPGRSEERPDDGRAQICIEGHEAIAVDAGTAFSRVRELAARKGITKFRLWLNGTEIDNPEDAPDKIGAGDRIKIRRDDQAASHWLIR